MKYFLSALMLLLFFKAFGQNEITTPTGQPLKVGLLNLSSGTLMLNDKRYLSTAGLHNIFLGEDSGSSTISGAENTFFGYSSGIVNTTGKWNTYLGSSSGKSNTTGYNNVFVGWQSGRNNSTGVFNVFLGGNSGLYNSTGNYNTAIGAQTGVSNTTGENNTLIGNGAGYTNATGSYNTMIGEASGTNSTAGTGNTFLGSRSGKDNQGSNNVFLGYYAGASELGSNKLYIANTDTSSPLIYGDFSVGKLIFNGQVGAGTSNFPSSVSVLETNGSTSVKNTSAYKLFVKNGILTEQLIITSGWADYVFDESYKLRPLSEVEQYIRHNGHLPNVPSAVTVGKTGIDVGDMTRIQQEKIEELTLYLIEMEKKMDIQNQEVKKQNHEMKKRDLDIKKQDQEIKMLRELVMQFTQKNNK